MARSLPRVKKGREFRPLFPSSCANDLTRVKNGRFSPGLALEWSAEVPSPMTTTTKQKNCTARIFDGLWPRDCGRTSKGRNSDGEHRCGIHSDEAAKRRADERERRALADRERAARHAAEYGLPVMLTTDEIAALRRLVEDAQRPPCA